LPLVASLLVTIILVATGNEKKVGQNVAIIRSITEASPGPTKTQNKTQWEYIAKVCIQILNALNFDENTGATVLEKRYGYSCLEVLHSLAENAGA
jgi:energy-converting hydrogenase A subunit M